MICRYGVKQNHVRIVEKNLGIQWSNVTHAVHLDVSPALVKLSVKYVKKVM